MGAPLRKCLVAIAMGAMAVMPALAASAIYNVGSTPTGMPFTYVDARSNTVQGVMVDLIEAIGEDAGFEPKINVMSFSALISALTTRRIDIISAAMVKTEERARRLAFSKPLLAYGEGLVVRDEDTTPYTDFAGMKGMTVGVQLGTAYVEPAQASGMFRQIKQYDSFANMLKDLQNRRVDAVLLDYPIARMALEQPRFKGLHLVESYRPSVVRDVCLVVRKDDADLQVLLNDSIDRLKKEGAVDRVLAKWGLKH